MRDGPDRDPAWRLLVIRVVLAVLLVVALILVLTGSYRFKQAGVLGVVIVGLLASRFALGA